MVLCNRYIFWHILGKFKKIPRNDFFSKSQKPQNDVKYGIFGPKVLSRLNKAKIQKSGRVTFLIILFPNFVPNLKKILGAVAEIIRSVRTHGRTYGRTEAIL